MGWAPGNARWHVIRLTRERWLDRVARPRCTGSLFYATRLGVKVAGVDVPPSPVPAPIWWDHLDASAWVAAWLTIRGAGMIGARELIADRSWHAEVRAGPGSRPLVHTPDLVGVAAGRRPAAIEVELARKSKARLRAILGLYYRWIASGKLGACVYVCGNHDVYKLVIAQAAQVGLNTADGSLRVEMLNTVKQLVREDATAVPRGTAQSETTR
ncbi:MAG: hypothetical protein ACRDNS_17695 [Trebonia sp.]